MPKIVFYSLRAHAREHPYFWPKMPLQMCAMSRWKGSRLVRLENRPKMSSRRAKSIPDIFLGWWDAPFPPLEPLDFAQNTLFLAISNGSRGEERYPIPPIFFSKILLILLEDVSGRFSNLTNLEPFHLDIAHIYRGISGQKQGCSRACTCKLQNTNFGIFHLCGSYLGYHNMKLAFVGN